MWFIAVEVEQETSAPPPKKNPGSAPVIVIAATSIKIQICIPAHIMTSYQSMFY